MRFEKFVKSLGSTGTIYERENGDRWLASGDVYMLIPPTIESIAGTKIAAMPKNVEKMILAETHTTPAQLTAAYMPVPSGGIKDCQREFRSAAEDLPIRIANDGFALLDKTDIIEIFYTYDLEHDTQDAKALFVKNYPLVPDDPDKLVGIIFPISL